MTTHVGILSDTHGFLDPKIPALFARCQHILHAGDIGDPTIIDELLAIAPVTAVLGNNDLGLAFQEIEVVDIQKHRFLIQHIVQPDRPRKSIGPRLDSAHPNVIVFGHTHVPAEIRRENLLFVNPGYSGRPRGGCKRSVAIASVSPNSLEIQFLTLD